MLRTTVALLLLCLSLLHAETITCEGTYRSHLQGIDSDGTFIWWSFTNTLVKTDMSGKVVLSVPVTSHCGDICVHDGKLYAAINRGPFNKPTGSRDELQVFDANTLTLLKTYPVEEYNHGFGAVEYHNGHLWLTGGLPPDSPANIILEYTEDMQLVKRHEVPPYTFMGIQTLNFALGHWWFGVYGKPATLLLDEQFKVLPNLKAPNLSVGMAALPDGTVLVASTPSQTIPADPKPKKIYSGVIRTAVFNPETNTLSLKQD